jgi:hypothetical protein
MLTIFKSLVKLKDNWPKRNINRKFFLRYDEKKRSKFLEDIGIVDDKLRIGHPEAFNYVKIGINDFYCFVNITHSKIITKNGKFFEGKYIGVDKFNKPIYLFIDDLKLQQVDLISMKNLLEDISSQVCKLEYNISKNENIQDLHTNVIVVLENYFKDNNYTEFFLNHKQVGLSNFLKETEKIFIELKNNINNYGKND